MAHHHSPASPNSGPGWGILLFQVQATGIRRDLGEALAPHTPALSHQRRQETYSPSIPPAGERGTGDPGRFSCHTRTSSGSHNGVQSKYATGEGAR